MDRSHWDVARCGRGRWCSVALSPPLLGPLQTPFGSTPKADGVPGQQAVSDTNRPHLQICQLYTPVFLALSPGSSPTWWRDPTEDRKPAGQRRTGEPPPDHRAAEPCAPGTCTGEWEEPEANPRCAQLGFRLVQNSGGTHACPGPWGLGLCPSLGSNSDFRQGQSGAEASRGSPASCSTPSRCHSEGPVQVRTVLSRRRAIHHRQLSGNHFPSLSLRPYKHKPQNPKGGPVPSTSCLTAC